ncbi:MAG TPA: 50S ribosomal protein L10 [Chloroflexia bacterium]|nr:50S ribosomal protein L10 [Chloroflexia bacterium]
MPTVRKEKTIAELTTLLRDSQVAVVTDYRGLSVAAISQLRRSLRGKAELHVTKNTLLIRAAQDANVPQLSDLLTGPTAIAFVQDDIAGSIKVLNDFVRTSRIMTLRGALFGPSLVPADKVGDLANVPTRPQLYGQVVGSLQGPLNNLVGSLNQLYSQVVFALQAYADKQGEGAAPAGEASAESAFTADAGSATDSAPDETAAASAPAAEAADTAPAAELVADTTPAADAAPAAETTTDTAPVAETAADAEPAAGATEDTSV